MPQRKEKRPRTAQGALKRGAIIAYRVVVVLAFLVVALYALSKFLVRPPAVEAPVVTQPVLTATPPPDGDGAPAAPTPTPLMRKEDYHTVLLMGCDDGNGNADTIMVASFDVKNKRVGLVSVPRDTLVDVSRTVKKINAAYGLGGIEQVQSEVSALLGFPVDHYVQINVKAFEAVVDAVGGIDFNVPQNMYHNDGAGFVIDLKKGPQHLSGHQALELVRFRGYPNADIGRIEVQQRFLSVMAKKVLSFSSLTKVTAFLDIFAKYVKTDLSVGNLAYFAMEAMELDTAQGVTAATLPGDGLTSYKGIDYYYELFPEETLAILNDCLNPYTTPLTSELTHIFQVP
ncbi:MAG: LCP family protein [Oscillospiraceae bacterium]